MAKHGNVVILHQLSPLSSLPRASTTIFMTGDLVSDESNLAVNMDAATEDATFAGVAATAHESGDDTNVAVCDKCIIEIDAVSAAYSHLAPLKYNAGSASVEYSVAADGGFNTIMHVWGEYAAGSTRIKALVNVSALQKLAAVNA